MFLTLFYAAATWMQSWRMRTVSTNLAKQINSQLSISFYNANEEGNGMIHIKK